MVVFTCSHCGEPVKKPAVSKHYSTKCYGRNPNLTCVDCLKDFRGSEYEAHTKCISEKERYGAKGSSAGPTVNKGEKKQQEWAEHVQEVLNSAKLKQDERNVIELISKHENVPRNQKKFENFLNNAYRSMRFSNDLVNRVWQKIKPESTITNNSSNKSEDKENSDKPEKNVFQESKKRKLDDSSINTVLENSDGTSDTLNSKKSKKLKKEKKDKKSNEDFQAVENSGNLNGVESKSSKKDKKKLKNKNCEETIPEIIIDDSAELKSSKKRKNSVQEGALVENVDLNGVDVESSKKKGKKKSKDKTVQLPENFPQEESILNEVKKKKKAVNGKNLESSVEVAHENTSSKNSENCEQVFSWKDNISDVLAKYSNEEKVLIKKIQKKVFQRYLKTVGNALPEKKEKKFLHKLRKIENITIKDEYVILHK